MNMALMPGEGRIVVTLQRFLAIEDCSWVPTLIRRRSRAWSRPASSSAFPTR
jgi:hypothetical protein